MPSTLPVIRRDQLRSFLKDERAVREFEAVFAKMQDIIDNATNISTNTDDIVVNEAYIINNGIDIAANTADILLRALLNGSATELFSVANSTLSTHAVNQSQVQGINQTWQDVSASRAVSTSYQNTTGKPIHVYISAASTTAADIQVSADNIAWVNVGRTHSGSSAENTFIVPDDHYYRVNGASTIRTWTELR